MNTTIQTIPHSQQRYPTCGDWWFDELSGDLNIRVSELGDWRMEALIASHEMHEAMLCKARGITTKMVDEFDMAFEESRKPGDTSEPGDCFNAPYYEEHFFATNVERQLALELHVNWNDYADKVEAL